MEMVVYNPRKAGVLAPYKKPRRAAGGAMVMYRAPRVGYRPGLRGTYRGLNRRGVASRETGYVDLASAGYAFDTTGSITLLATIAQGASTSQRVGKKVLYKSLQLRGSYFPNTTAVVNDCALLIVYDKRPTGSLPAITDVLNSANANSFNNDANSGRFRILKRVDFTLSGNSTTPATDSCIVEADFYLNLRRLPLTFKLAGTGAIGDIEEGALYAITVGTNAAGTTAASGTLAYRTRYWDV